MKGSRALSLGLVLIFVAACGGAAVPRPSATPKPNDQLSALIAGARTELELTLSWTPGFMDSPQELKRYIEGFNRTYGLNLRVTFTPGLPIREMTARTIEEFKRSAKASTDVVLGAETDISDLQRASVLVTEPWLQWASNVNNPRAIAAAGVAVRVQTRIPGITYNSAKLAGSLAPRTLADLLRPQYKGRVATTADPVVFERLASADVWGRDKTLGYVRSLAPQLGGYLNCGDEARIAEGDFDVFVYDCGSARVNQMKAKGTLIGWAVPTDGALLGYLYMGVPKNAAHPNAAKLWINYMLSREAQDAMYEFGFTDYHLASGSKSFAEVDKMTKNGVKFYELTVERVLVDVLNGGKTAGPDLRAILPVTPARR